MSLFRYRQLAFQLQALRRSIGNVLLAAELLALGSPSPATLIALKEEIAQSIESLILLLKILEEVENDESPKSAAKSNSSDGDNSKNARRQSITFGRKAKPPKQS